MVTSAPVRLDWSQAVTGATWAESPALYPGLSEGAGPTGLGEGGSRPEGEVGQD